MTNPVTQAFFFGRALAEVLNEKIENNLTNALSELGKFDAEQRENLRRFMEEVSARAEKEVGKGSSTGTGSGFASYNGESSGDLQEMIDELRAEIARLRAELKNHRNSQ